MVTASDGRYFMQPLEDLMVQLRMIRPVKRGERVSLPKSKVLVVRSDLKIVIRAFNEYRLRFQIPPALHHRYRTGGVMRSNVQIACPGQCQRWALDVSEHFVGRIIDFLAAASQLRGLPVVAVDHLEAWLAGMGRGKHLTPTASQSHLAIQVTLSRPSCSFGALGNVLRQPVEVILEDLFRLSAEAAQEEIGIGLCSRARGQAGYVSARTLARCNHLTAFRAPAQILINIGEDLRVARVKIAVPGFGAALALTYLVIAEAAVSGSGEALGEPLQSSSLRDAGPSQQFSVAQLRERSSDDHDAREGTIGTRQQ